MTYTNNKEILNNPRAVLLALMALLILLALACNYPGVSRATATPDLLVTYAQETIDAQSTLDASAGEADATGTVAAAGATGTALFQTATALTVDTGSTATAGNATLAAQQTGAAWQLTLQAATLQALTANAPTFTPPPTITQMPSATLPLLDRISFAQGATSANVDGSLQAGALKEYAIRALAGQTMLANIYSAGDHVYLGVVGMADGIPLLRPIAEETGFRGVLPATQDYRLTVAAPFVASNYTLQVIIPARIQFQTGATSAWLEGFLTGGNINHYLAWAAAGQTMHVKLTSPGNDVLLTVYGFDTGDPLVRYVSGAWEWSGTLPASQDYMIHAVSVGGSTNYRLDISIE